MFSVRVIDSFSVVLSSNASLNDTYSVGDDIHLTCHVQGPMGVESSIRWSRDGHVLHLSEHAHSANERLSVSESRDELAIMKAIKDDQAEYGCEATRRLDDGEVLTASASVNITIEGVAIPDKCVDKPWYANCLLILEARLCRHAYFSVFCCKTCYEAGHLP